MVLKENAEIKEISERLKAGMIDYIDPEDTMYTEKDVATCMDILSDYLEEMGKADSSSNGLQVVEKTVNALNELNDNCGAELIETDQREDIAEIIILGGYLKGFNSRETDITEAWREW